jgi:hypothetical protein
MYRTLRRSALLLAVVAATLWSAAPASASAGTAIQLPTPYKVTYVAGVTQGTYTVVQPALGVTTTLSLSGTVASTNNAGCYVAQAVIQRSGVTAYVPLATACTTTPVAYTYSATAIVTQSPSFGIRLCLAGGGCSAVKALPASGIVAA